MSHLDYNNGNNVLLNGREMSIETIVRIANGAPVEIDPKSLLDVVRAYEVLLHGAAVGQEIYGLTVGVGWNKDRQMVDAKGAMTPDLMEASQSFNEGLLRAHSVGVGPDVDVPIVRAAMAIRLNAILTGGPGVQPQVAEMLVAFLNNDITPIIPSRGSVGQADMTLLSHIGVAMLGEGDVIHCGRRMTARDALNVNAIKPLKPCGKDGLAILSSNAYATALAAFAIRETEQLLSASYLVYALSLEGLNGNVSPLLEDVAALRPFPGHYEATTKLRAILEDSYLWQKDEGRVLQDPMSFRTAAYLFACLGDRLDRAKALIELQINTPDDNPSIVLGVEPRSDRSQARRYYVDGGAILPSANFCPLPWVTALEEIGILLAHLTNASAERVLKLINPTHSKLPRYLGTESTHHAFLVVEAPLMALATENRALALPTSFDSRPIAGGVEDLCTNAPFVVERLRALTKNSFTILSIEMMHAAQAADLRLSEVPDRTLSKETKSLYTAFRQRVKFLDQDRCMTPDIAAGEIFLREFGVAKSS